MFAPEGFWFLASSVAASIITGATGLLTRQRYWLIASGLSFLLTAGFFFFFRNPTRPLPPAKAIVSPVDGTVLEVEEMPSGQVRVAVFLSLFNVHAVRSPATGVVNSVRHLPGKFHPAFQPEAGIENEHVHILLGTEAGIIDLKVMSGVLARRIVCPVKEGQELHAGQRIGFVRFGSRAELIFPLTMQPLLKKGDKIVGGITVIAKTKEELSAA